MTMDEAGGSPRATGVGGEGHELTPDELAAVAGGTASDVPPYERPPSSDPPPPANGTTT